MNAGEPGWNQGYCIADTFEWVNYFILSVFLSFLLAMHCIMYKRINKKWSWRILKRNRVQVLILSLSLVIIYFIKETFIFIWADLLIIVIGQLLRFLIWSLTLMNFMKSVTSLFVNPRFKLILKFLRLYVVVGTLIFVAYAITLVLV